MKVALVGLGYVGLPLALEFGKKFPTLGFDIATSKIESYKNKVDPNGEVDASDFESAKNLSFSDNPEDLSNADFIVIAVPTPVDESKQPDFSPLISACSIVGKQMKKGAIVVFESTVFPGATEEICVPVLEKFSSKKWKEDFSVGYSPERINPGDKVHTLTKITKVVAADNLETLKVISELYSSVIDAGVYEASSIKVAEAAKVIENTQRDLNIALINELAIIFNKLDIDTQDVLDAAGTKWNFLKFKPGLVGGHCIGVDPYYLTHKSMQVGHIPEVILSGRKINDSMAEYIANEAVKKMVRMGINVSASRVIVLGLTFKEDCSDLRNSKVPDLINHLKSYGCEVKVHDPIASPEHSMDEYGIDFVEWDDLQQSDLLVFAVPHEYYLKKGIEEISKKITNGGLLVDVKSVYTSLDLDPDREIKIWRL